MINKRETKEGDVTNKDGETGKGGGGEEEEKWESDKGGNRESGGREGRRANDKNERF